MRLQGQKSRVYKGKAYHKHWVVLPNDLLETLGWKVGDELKAEAKNGKLTLGRE